MNHLPFPQTLRLAAAGAHDALFDRLADRLKRTVGFSHLTVLVPDEAGEYLRRIYTTDAAAHPLEPADRVEDNPWFERLFTMGEPVVAADPQEIAHWLPDYKGFAGTSHGALVNYPIVADGQTVGIINLVSRANAYDERTPGLVADSVPLAAMAIATYARNRAPETALNPGADR